MLFELSSRNWAQYTLHTRDMPDSTGRFNASVGGDMFLREAGRKPVF
jgi:hypothetical protein